MRAPFTAIALVLVTAAATASVVVPDAAPVSGAAPGTAAAGNVAPAAAAQAVAPEAQRAPAEQLVTGLPDFTRLVEQVGPGVVNIEATIGSRTAQRGQRRGGQMPNEEMMPEIFRRILGPEFPFPGAPQGPDGPGPRGTSMGTGFLVSADGYLLTNHHVVANADQVKVRLHDRREFDAEVVGSDEQSDVAVLKIDASGLPVLRAGDSRQVRPGQWAVAIGSPFGLDQSVTAGIVSAVGRSNPYANQRYVPFIQTDVAINRGNSGGPLLNTRGEVIGINSQIFSNSGGYMGVSFAIPIDMAMNVAEQIKSTGSVQRGQVGVVVEAVNAEKAAGLGLPDTLGALVNSVQPGSPAEKAGIEVGDVIRAVDGSAINQSSDLPPIIGSKAPGTRVRLEVFREGRSRNVDVTLSQLDEGAAVAAAGGPDAGRTPGAASSNPLGLVGQDLTAAQRRQLGLGADEGVRIARVEGLAAREAGIQPGDVVLRVGRTPVAGAAALDRQLRDVRAGQTVMLLVNRGGTTQFIAVTPREGGED
ncbi:Do family serine endopeptidase [Luteimonas sp. SJ-92]|uniref:Probable periplasmic serine endoprotease DegP-like n=1 Tax=Luteimonas salinisoli TaxID=2752307 RepID=A0A853JBE4_9GAMM|nr:Do family serine endopeptidase [Luteimonas salinisoli]NZA25969.1 Do family serine endopeptidase [Luteimonas salinisoli]